MSGRKRLTSAAVVFIASVMLANTASASPSITLSKKSGPPTSGILVSGRGFEPNVGLDIYFDTKDEALVVTNGKGEFDKAKIHAPRNARPGKHWVTALERNNDKGAQEPFLVQTNWTEFDGPTGTRRNPYENVLGTNTVGALTLKWSYTSGNQVFSSPAVVNAVLYVGSEDGNFYALNASTGSKLWVYSTGRYIDSSPAVADGTVYFGCYDGKVYALNARTGALRWSYTTGGEVDSSPAVSNGVVYVGSQDDNVYALNARTGALLWSYKTGNHVYSSPAVANGFMSARTTSTSTR